MHVCAAAHGRSIDSHAPSKQRQSKTSPKAKRPETEPASVQVCKCASVQALPALRGHLGRRRWCASWPELRRRLREAGVDSTPKSTALSAQMPIQRHKG
eukprot:scaffold7927_cov296-Pinguiococcus_pyrenoidosus.AAC.4